MRPLITWRTFGAVAAGIGLYLGIVAVSRFHGVFVYVSDVRSVGAEGIALWFVVWVLIYGTAILRRRWAITVALGTAVSVVPVFGGGVCATSAYMADISGGQRPNTTGLLLFIYLFTRFYPALIGAMAGITLGVTARGATRIMRKLTPGTCPQCGYDLTGNVSGRCPECGAPSR